MNDLIQAERAGMPRTDCIPAQWRIQRSLSTAQQIQDEDTSIQNIQKTFEIFQNLTK